MLCRFILPSFALPLLALGQGTASVYFANYNFPTIFTGQKFTLAWIGNGLPVNISLAYGPLTNLQRYTDVTTDNLDKTYTWTVPADLPTDNYVFQIFQTNSSANRSPQFTISGAVIRGAVVANQNASSNVIVPANFSGIVPTVLPKSTTIQSGSTLQTLTQPATTPGATEKAVPVLDGIPPLQIWVEDKAVHVDHKELIGTPTTAVVATATDTSSVLVTATATATDTSSVLVTTTQTATVAPMGAPAAFGGNHRTMRDMSRPFAKATWNGRQTRRRRGHAERRD